MVGGLSEEAGVPGMLALNAMKLSSRESDFPELCGSGTSSGRKSNMLGRWDVVGGIVVPKLQPVPVIL